MARLVKLALLQCGLAECGLVVAKLPLDVQQIIRNVLDVKDIIDHSETGLMPDPIVASDGHTYDRDVAASLILNGLNGWVGTRLTSPGHIVGIPNEPLKALAREIQAAPGGVLPELPKAFLCVDTKAFCVEPMLHKSKLTAHEGMRLTDAEKKDYVANEVMNKIVQGDLFPKVKARISEGRKELLKKRKEERKPKAVADKKKEAERQQKIKECLAAMKAEEKERAEAEKKKEAERQQKIKGCLAAMKAEEKEREEQAHLERGGKERKLTERERAEKTNEIQEEAERRANEGARELRNDTPSVLRVLVYGAFFCFLVVILLLCCCCCCCCGGKTSTTKKAVVLPVHQAQVMHQAQVQHPVPVQTFAPVPVQTPRYY